MNDIKTGDESFLACLKSLYQQFLTLFQESQITPESLLQLNALIAHFSKLQKEAYQKARNMEYASCSHVVVCTHVDYQEARRYYGCLACGLNQWVLSEDAEIGSLTQEQQIMQDFLLSHQMSCAIKSDRVCDFTLARAIYSSIIKTHPNIDTVTAFQYFQSAYENTVQIAVNQDRKMNRAKRLGLHPNFFFNKNDGAI